jgi:hypothetical protein
VCELPDSGKKKAGPGDPHGGLPGQSKSKEISLGLFALAQSFLAFAWQLAQKGNTMKNRKQRKYPSPHLGGMLSYQPGAIRFCTSF